MPVTTQFDTLLEYREQFLAFLKRRVHDRNKAEDILQAAYMRALEHEGNVQEHESIVGWFYRVLRNAVIDRQRRKGAEDRALATFAQELAGATHPDDDLHREICACVGRLARTLKPEYAEVLQAVDVEETPVKAFADTAGLTTSNAGVRLFRAREALRKQVTASCGTCAEHGCLDCSCQKP